MEKEEILQRSRRENKNGDEREIGINRKSFALAACVGMLVCMVFSILEPLIFDREVYDLWCIYTAIQCTAGVVQYLERKKRLYLVTAILFAITFVLYLGLYLSDCFVG